MISFDFLSIYIVRELLEGGLRSVVCRWHRIATFEVSGREGFLAAY